MGWRMLPTERKPKLLMQAARLAALLAGTAVLIWLVLRVLASIHRTAGV